MKLSKLFKKKKDVAIVLVKTTTVFSQVTEPNFTQFSQELNLSAKALNNIYQTRYTIEEEFLEDRINDIIEEGKVFRKLTQQSIPIYEKIVSFCSKIIKLVLSLSKENMRGTIFIEKSMKLLRDHEKRIQKDREEIRHSEKCIATVIEQAGKKDPYELVGNITAAIATAAAIGGLISGSLFVFIAREKDTSISSFSQNILNQLEYIVNVINNFDNFWDIQIKEITDSIRKFEDIKNDHGIRYDQDKAEEVIDKWKKIIEEYAYYIATLKGLGLALY
ncbi:11082_t:CDS:2 [Dentiscutata erythropus]|uniref:11082_t:CDS:1 n=1 Tax=Dentiscutata erythropus TaxID=1348616 RepID=A0A9N9F217_9GLOM|nr:11082_t:CDS:2 [Dentiscutata erythropus]